MLKYSSFSLVQRGFNKECARKEFNEVHLSLKEKRQNDILALLGNPEKII